jgi:hypothetical protein
VVDDHSSDEDVESLVWELGKGRVGFYRQPTNVGSLRNFETCINRAQGHYVHLLHGDDLVKPGFYSEIEKLFNEFPEAGAAFTGFTYIDQGGIIKSRSEQLARQAGILPDWLQRIARAQRIQPPAIAVRRTVYEQLGSFYAVQYAEDWEMWVRIAAHYPVAYSPKRLACYRIHNTNITSRSLVTGQSMRDLVQVVDLIQEYLPEDYKKEIKSGALKHASKYFAFATDKVYHELHEPEQALDLAKSALSMDRNPVTLYFLLKTRLKILFHYKYDLFSPTQNKRERHKHSFFPLITRKKSSIKK